MFAEIPTPVGVPGSDIIDLASVTSLPGTPTGAGFSGNTGWYQMLLKLNSYKG